jgi:hypothetical protein
MSGSELSSADRPHFLGESKTSAESPERALKRFFGNRSHGSMWLWPSTFVDRSALESSRRAMSLGVYLDMGHTKVWCYLCQYIFRADAYLSLTHQGPRTILPIFTSITDMQLINLEFYFFQEDIFANNM